MMLLRLTICALIVLWLAGCASSPGGDYPDTPGSSGIDLSEIPPAVPKEEPPSKYGNPERYTVFGQTYYPLDSADNFSQIGMASWYGRKFHGQRTSSGEPYNMYRMTAAHKILPLPTYVRVTNLRNGKKVIVRVNDRGPFVDDRIIDLSYVAALKLGMAQHGVTRVRIEAITGQDGTHDSARDRAPITSLPPATDIIDFDQSGLYLQVGAYARRGNARHMSRRLQAMGITAISIAPLQRNGVTLYRVRVGPFSRPRTRQAVQRDIAAQGIPVITVAP